MRPSVRVSGEPQQVPGESPTHSRSFADEWAPIRPQPVHEHDLS